ncbi:PAAR domain-containing protein [Variovorax sp. J2P1-59]|uniref:PAAR domain-containing protein n=1 Tax=Variovorax flavidus TaxID=3053501 RepID=UPI002576B0DC|nr:PAAR domain-containing protein [Variovorax sp. J2P1-59]MDM0075615.1 PAAR domain-containing protein [Variovorax sp. J2P1-59]
MAGESIFQGGNMDQFARSCVREGDTTTTGGRVEARPQQWPVTYGNDRKHATFEGDPVWCPACESYGVTQCVPPYRRNTGPDGRQKNLDGDLCLCRCPSPPRLIAKFNNVRTSFSVEEVLSMPGSGAWLEFAGHSLAGISKHAAHDEQVLLEWEEVEGVPYRIEVNDGRVLTGVVGPDGLLPRVQTLSEAEYTVYWGDEALARAMGAAS